MEFLFALIGSMFVMAYIFNNFGPRSVVTTQHNIRN